MATATGSRGPSKGRQILGVVAFPIFWIAFGAYLFFSAAEIEVLGQSDLFGPGAFPQVVGGLLIACGAWLLVSEFRRLRTQAEVISPDEGSKAAADRDEQDFSIAPDDYSAWRPAAVIALTVVYVFVLPFAGYIVSTVLAIAAIATLVAREFRWKLALIFSGVTTALLFLLFSGLLGIRLP